MEVGGVQHFKKCCENLDWALFMPALRGIGKSCQTFVGTRFFEDYATKIDILCFFFEKYTFKQLTFSPRPEGKLSHLLCPNLCPRMYASM